MSTPTLHPNISVSDARAAIDFYVRAFDARLVSVMESHGVVVHSELTLGGVRFTVATAIPTAGSVAPEAQGPTHASFTLEVDDADAWFTRAVAAGATAVEAPADQFYGGRSASLRDPFGHRWFVNQFLREVDPAELQATLDAWMAPEQS